MNRCQKEGGISLEVQYFEDGENLWHEMDAGERIPCDEILYLYKEDLRPSFYDDRKPVVYEPVL